MRAQGSVSGSSLTRSGGGAHGSVWRSSLMARIGFSPPVSRQLAGWRDIPVGTTTTFAAKLCSRQRRLPPTSLIAHSRKPPLALPFFVFTVLDIQGHERWHGGHGVRLFDLGSGSVASVHPLGPFVIPLRGFFSKILSGWGNCRRQRPPRMRSGRSQPRRRRRRTRARSAARTRG